MAAASAGQQAVVDLQAISSVPGPPLLAHAGVGAYAGSDAFCLQEEKKQQNSGNLSPVT